MIAAMVIATEIIVAEIITQTIQIMTTAMTMEVAIAADAVAGKKNFCN